MSSPLTPMVQIYKNQIEVIGEKFYVENDLKTELFDCPGKRSHRNKNDQVSIKNVCASHKVFALSLLLPWI